MRTPMKRILVVDDDAFTRALIQRALPEFEVLLAPDGDTALAIARQVGAIDLLITDYFMPSMMGDEVVARIREIKPNIKVLVVSGHSEILSRELPQWWASEMHLAKPIRLDAIRDAVTRIVAPTA
jgi:CheY-like chemotaxis protein